MPKNRSLTKIPRFNLVLLVVCFAMIIYMIGGIVEIVLTGHIPNNTAFLGTIVDLRIQYFIGLSIGLPLGIFSYFTFICIYKGEVKKTLHMIKSKLCDYFSAL